MTKIVRKESRQAWSTPELRRIDAGSAKAQNNVDVVDDGGGASQDKS